MNLVQDNFPITIIYDIFLLSELYEGIWWKSEKRFKAIIKLMKGEAYLISSNF